MKYHILIDIHLSAPSRIHAEAELKRIYVGVDDCVAEQNDPAKTTIRGVLHDAKGVVRSITAVKRPP